MPTLTHIGRIFYGIAVAAMGFITIYYRDFPYMFIPPHHAWISDHVTLIYLCGVLLFLAGVCIALGTKLLPASRLLGAVLLLIFCFYFVPYDLGASSRYLHFGQWENAAKELALAAGALVIARYNWAVVLFALTIFSFGVDHYLYGREAADYIPGWIPNKLFWMYLTGTALLASSLAIIMNIKRRLAACLLGAMIFIWVLILHLPRTMAAPFAENEGEITSAFLALAYCGIAFIITGTPFSPPVGTKPGALAVDYKK